MPLKQIILNVQRQKFTQGEYEELIRAVYEAFKQKRYSLISRQGDTYFEAIPWRRTKQGLEWWQSMHRRRNRPYGQ